MKLAYQIFSSPIGEILVAGNAFAITQVKHGTDKSLLAAEFRMENEDASVFDSTGYVKDACKVISDYLHGKVHHIDVAVQLDGTEFQRKVWHAISQIPYGSTSNYSAIAESLGMPEAFRAVANACGDNPVPLIIPCHRVVHKSGEMSGFAWGIEAKKYLLNMEKEALASFAEA
jgi:AraC family transcriptional regulator of adaptative response/methylated-DNA-[protein]-cysteine methyltransferase